MHLQPRFKLPCWSRAALSLLRLKRITQGGGEGDGGLSCAWARPEPGCPHTDRGRVQRTLDTRNNTDSWSAN